MASLEESLINGEEIDEEAIVDEMLRQETAKHAAPPPPAAQRRPEKIIVSIPKDEHGKPDNSRATVTKVEVLPDGNFKVLEPKRPVGPADRAMIVSGRKQLLSGDETTAVVDPSAAAKAGRPWWHYGLAALGAVAVVGVGYTAVQYVRGGEDEDFEDEEED